MQGIDTANSDEENTGGGEEAEMLDMILTSTFLGGVTGAALGSFLTAGRAVSIFGEVSSLLLSIYHSLKFLCLSLTSENYTCMHMTLNIKRHINFLIRHIIY